MALPHVLVAFRTAPDSPPVASVDLWYTKDGGGTWKQQTGAIPTISPIPFDAPEDGLYGFFLVLHNAAGASSPPPAPGTKPQQCIRVDRTSPIVQVLEFRSDDHFEINREIHIRWSIKDDDLPDRPVELHYRTEQSKAYLLIADHQAADSSYRWTVPNDVSGRLEVKISATDRAGNTGRYVADWLKIDRDSGRITKMSAAANVDRIVDSPDAGAAGAPRANRRLTLPLGKEAKDSERKTAGASPLEPTGFALRPDRSTGEPAARNAAFRDPPGAWAPVDEKTAQEADKLYEIGTYHRLRGEHDLAVERFREALKLNPDLLKARNDLAGVLIVQGQQETAEREYLAVLARDPVHPAALKGLALLQTMRRNYDSARRTLERLIEVAPTDAEAWLYLGDVQMLAGERNPARASWEKAAVTEGVNPEVKQRAEKRLEIYRDAPAGK